MDDVDMKPQSYLEDLIEDLIDQVHAANPLLTQWECGFIESVHDQWEQAEDYSVFTPKVEDVMERIKTKLDL